MKRKIIYKQVFTLFLYLIESLIMFPQLGKSQEKSNIEKQQLFLNVVKKEKNPYKLLFIIDSLEKTDIYQSKVIMRDLVLIYATNNLSKNGNFSLVKNTIDKNKSINGRIKLSLLAAKQYISDGKLNYADSLILPILDHIPFESKFNANDSITIFHKTKNEEIYRVYASLLFKRKSYSKAFRYFNLSNILESRDIREKEQYAMTLIKINKKEMIFCALKNAYDINGNNSSDFMAVSKKYLLSLSMPYFYSKLKDSLAKIQSELNASDTSFKLISINAPNFKLKKEDGTFVGLSDFRGKIVILDFWATWCKPCIASFPDLENAYHYFKNDTSIAFMFINTLEKKENPLNFAKRFLIEKGWRDLPLYIDEQDSTLKTNLVVDQFNIQNIPTKIIIDQNGKIRFKFIGYEPQKNMVEEFKKIIKIINEEKL